MEMLRTHPGIWDLKKDSYQQRKDQRRLEFEAQQGKKLVRCTSCSGSGYYDHNGSPKCGACNGTGKHRET